MKEKKIEVHYEMNNIPTKMQVQILARVRGFPPRMIMSFPYMQSDYNEMESKAIERASKVLNLIQSTQTYLY